MPNPASDVIALLDELGIPQADFLGGPIALEIAVRHPVHAGRHARRDPHPLPRTADGLRGLAAPTLLFIGDADFVLAPAV